MPYTARIQFPFWSAVGIHYIELLLLLLLTEKSVRDEFQCQHIGSGSPLFVGVSEKKKGREFCRLVTVVFARMLFKLYSILFDFLTAEVQRSSTFR